MDSSSFTTGFAGFLTSATVITGFLSSSISLISALMFRNAHLSDRSREVVREALANSYAASASQVLVKFRYESLWSQNQAFVERYALTGKAIKSAITSLMLLIFSIVLASASGHDGDELQKGFLVYSSLGFLIWSAGLFAHSLRVLRAEFSRGVETMTANDETLVELQKLYNPADPKKRDWTKLDV